MTNPWKRMSPRWRRSLIVIACVIVIGFVLDLAVVVGFSLFHPKVPAKVDAVVVLGAKVGTPALKYRTLAGLAYYQAGKTDTIVLSGGRGPGESVSEAQAMKTVIEQQLKRTRQKMPHLVLDTTSTDTFQNLSNSKALVPHARSVVVVSDCYHLERSVAIAKHVGFHRAYWNSPKPTYYGNVDLAHYYVREAVAMILYAPKLM